MKYPKGRTVVLTVISSIQKRGGLDGVASRTVGRGGIQPVEGRQRSIVMGVDQLIDSSLRHGLPVGRRCCGLSILSKITRK